MRVPVPTEPPPLPQLTYELIEAICDNIRAGCALRDACLVAGIDHYRVVRWMARGGADKQGIYWDLQFAVRQAEAQVRAWASAKLLQHGDSDWRACDRFLQARGAEDWAPKDRTINVNIRNMTDDQILQELNGRTALPPGESAEVVETTGAWDPE